MIKGEMMKKCMGLVLAGVAVFALSGCDTGSDGDGSSGGDITYIDISDLDLGYVIDGHSSYGNDVRLVYCRNGYDYYRGSTHFDGTFNIKNDEIQMYDSASGTYIIDTDNYLIEVGEYYDIFDVADDITVDSIFETSC